MGKREESASRTFWTKTSISVDSILKSLAFDWRNYPSLCTHSTEHVRMTTGKSRLDPGQALLVLSSVAILGSQEAKRTPALCPHHITGISSPPLLTTTYRKQNLMPQMWEYKTCDILYFPLPELYFYFEPPLCWLVETQSDSTQSRCIECRYGSKGCGTQHGQCPLAPECDCCHYTPHSQLLAHPTADCQLNPGLFGSPRRSSSDLLSFQEF